MTPLRCWLAFALALGGACGCVAGGPQRASDIQNLNAISDGIRVLRTILKERSALRKLASEIAEFKQLESVQPAVAVEEAAEESA